MPRVEVNLKDVYFVGIEIYLSNSSLKRTSIINTYGCSSILLNLFFTYPTKSVIVLNTANKVLSIVVVKNIVGSTKGSSKTNLDQTLA